MAKRRTPKLIIAQVILDAINGVRLVDRPAIDAKFETKLTDEQWAKVEVEREKILKGVDKKVTKLLADKPAKVKAPAAEVAAAPAAAK